MSRTSNQTDFLCDIAPIVPLPFGRRDTYSYLSSEPVPVGSLVLIPFGPREIRGVVLGSMKLPKNQKTSGHLKKIRAILEPSFLTKAQIGLARTISADCLTPLGKTFRHFLPTRAKERTPKRLTVRKISFRSDKKENDTAVSILSGSKPVFLESPQEDALRILAGIARKLPKSSQMLVLVPERIALPHVERFFLSVFGSEVVATLSGSQSPGAFFSSWERTRSEKTRIVIGTRQALFAPFRKLRFIAVLGESETLGYKQWDMSPRYDARKVAEALASIHDAGIVFCDEVRSETMWYRKKHRDVRHVTVLSESGRPRMAIVNMREERFKKNYSLLSGELTGTIDAMRSRGLKSILIVSRSGIDRFSVCEECKAVPKCPQCDRALRSTREGRFRCGSCSFQTPDFPRCEKCGSLSFKSVGGGTEKIEQESRRRFPGSVILRMDERAFRGSGAEDAVIGSAPSSDIIIGTPSTLNLGTLPKIGLVAIMDTENFLSFPDFQADERFARIVHRAENMISEKKDEAFIIQTFRPEQELLRNLHAGMERKTLDRALEDRSVLRYPPFFSLFRIGFHSKEESRAETEASEAYKSLSGAIPVGADIRISPPKRPLSPKKRGKYERFLLISVPAGMSFPDPFRDILVRFSDWTFDPDPLSIL